MSTTVGTKLVYDFAEGSREMRDLLGGKGANVAEMTRLGLPVPRGFTITTEACIAYLRNGNRFPDGLQAEVDEHLNRLEEPRNPGARHAADSRSRGRTSHRWRRAHLP